MADIARLSVEDARREAVAGRALLVCAYGDERCRGVGLEGSIPLYALAARAGTLPRDQPIIFYCGCPAEGLAAGQAARYQAQGFRNVWALNDTAVGR